MELNNVEIERGEGGIATLRIEVAPATVQEMRQRVMKEYSKRLRVPGFRPGHVPAAIVRRQVGDEAIAQAVSDELVPQAYQKAIEQTKIQPLDRAQVDELTFEAFDGEQPLSFTAKVTIRPEMTLPEYKGIEAKQPRVEVTDDDVEKGLEELKQQRAHLHDVEGRGAQNGDILNAELRVFMDGEERGDTPGQLRGFVLGESGFVPAIDEHIVGQNLDEERRFPVSYPEDFRDEELAGKEAEFALKVTSHKERHLPELTDEFAQTLGLEDMAAVRERMREAILEGRTNESVDYVRGEIMKQLVEGTSFDVPVSLLDNRVQLRVQNVERELQMRGGTLEDYLNAVGKSQGEFEEELRDDVEREMKQELILDEIGQREELVASPEELEAHYYQVAQAMQQPIEEVAKRLDVEQARASIVQRKAMDFLVENAKIEEGEPLPTEVELEDDEVVEVQGDVPA